MSTTLPIQLIRPQQLDPGSENPVSPPGGGWHLLAEGDSWFSFGSIGGNNLLNRLGFGRRTLVTCTATPGDTLHHMVEWWRDPFFRRLIDGGRRGSLAWKFDAILFSGGGNDLIDAVNDQLVGQQLLKLLMPGVEPASVEDCIHPEAWALFEQYLRANLAAVASLVAGSAKNSATPIFVHTYDYPTPNNAPAVPGGHSWLRPAMEAHRIPHAMWVPLTDHLIDRLARVLRTLNLPNVHVIDTLGTLTRATLDWDGESGDWLNEIHPNPGGYSKLAGKWQSVIEGVIGPA
jgi:lysophospholipase L1-like esterase